MADKKNLKLEDRKLIEARFKAGKTCTEVANELKVHRSTIYNELHRCGISGYEGEEGRLRYSAVDAQLTV